MSFTWVRVRATLVPPQWYARRSIKVKSEWRKEWRTHDQEIDPRHGTHTQTHTWNLFLYGSDRSCDSYRIIPSFGGPSVYGDAVFCAPVVTKTIKFLSSLVHVHIASVSASATDAQKSVRLLSELVWTGELVSAWRWCKQLLYARHARGPFAIFRNFQNTRPALSPSIFRFISNLPLINNWRAHALDLLGLDPEKREMQQRRFIALTTGIQNAFRSRSSHGARRTGTVWS